MMCEHRFQTVSKKDQVYKCRKCGIVVVEGIGSLKPFEKFPYLKKKNVFTRFWEYLNNLFSNL